MRTISYELADTAGGAPWYARRIHLDRAGGGRYRRLDYLEVLAVVAGEGQLVSYPDDGPPRRRALLPGQALLLRPTDDPLLTATGSDGMTIVVVSFLLADWRMFASFVGIDSAWMDAPEPPVTEFDPADADARRPYETAVARYLDAPEPIDLLEFLLAVIPRLLPTRRSRAAQRMPSWLESSLYAMRQEENLRAGLPRLLELAHVSSAYLSVNTRRFLGRTPTEVVGDIRLRHAAQLLADTSDDIGVIARRCGFAQLSYFSKSFRRVHHVSPREYRRRASTGFVYGMFSR